MLRDRSIEWRDEGEEIDVEIADNMDGIASSFYDELEKEFMRAILEDDTSTIDQIAAATAMSLDAADTERALSLGLSIFFEDAGIDEPPTLNQFARVTKSEGNETNRRKMLKELGISWAKERTGRPKKEE
jgi:hypothetical protein